MNKNNDNDNDNNSNTVPAVYNSNNNNGNNDRAISRKKATIYVFTGKNIDKQISDQLRKYSIRHNELARYTVLYMPMHRTTRTRGRLTRRHNSTSIRGKSHASHSVSSTSDTRRISRARSTFSS